MSFRGARILPPVEMVMAGDAITVAQAFVANQGRILPVWLPRPMAFTRHRFRVSVQSGNMSIALYDNGFTRLFTTGAFAVPAAGAVDRAIGATWAVNPGLYYLGISCDNITARFLMGNNVRDTLTSGTMANAHPLPATFVRVAANVGFPLIGMVE